MKSILRRFLERWFPRIAREIRFRALREWSLTDLKSNRLFEPELLLVKQLLCGVKGACLDIGAHVGEYCYVLQRCVDASRIHAFEPNPNSCDLLKRFFPKICVWNVALSDSKGSAQLRVPIIKGKRYMTRGTLEQNKDSTSDQIITVQTMTIDDVVSEITSPIAFIKIDVEGHERKVLAGGKQTILRDHPILLVEIEERHSHIPAKEVFHEIEILGYTGWFFNFHIMNFQPIAEFDSISMQNIEHVKTPKYVNNFLFLHIGQQPPILGGEI